ncbi:MAG: tRNA (adenosine(37)-N6)-threonylcarbamoyltransferase complex ATPase subunit type 1 TsaE [Candidatus Omnitrophica bacterium]|jgi:tRNA threonylcarbamoyladenosine biosynthesis protein TsaE|nr:tRNA (adenosine(37)-N6)-threonylcarbamoyltransferase complex ATPase subunit type 1 TsaE [Candidatus Omnitrophota bacterium]
MIISKTSDRTIQLGADFSSCLISGDIVILSGELGGGKTTFIKGALRGLNYSDRVFSPSFTLINIYECKKFTVCHSDLYRLEVSDIHDTGLTEYLYAPDTVTFIEWGRKFEHLLDRYINIDFKYKSESTRIIKISFKGYSRAEQSRLKGPFTG